MSIPLIGIPAPTEPYIEDLISGDDSEFTSSVGNWTNSGGTLTRDTTAAYRLEDLSASLKFETTAQSQYTQLPLSGVFKAGVQYDCLIFLECESDAASGHSIEVSFGDYGTDVASFQFSSSNAALVGAGPDGHLLRWTPTADRTGVEIRVERSGAETGTVTYHVAWCRVAKVNTKLTSGLSVVRAPHLNSNQDSGIYLPSKFGDTWIAKAYNGDYIYVGSKTMGLVGAGGFQLYLTDGYNAIWAEHTPGDLADNGLNIAPGDDYVGMYISEADSSTLQFYADISGGNMMQLRHRGSGKGWSVSDDGSVNARIEAFFQWEFTVSGTLSTGTDQCRHFQVPNKAYIDEVRCHVDTAPTDASLIVDVNDDGTTVFTSQGNRPTIASGTNDDTSEAADGGTAVAKDSVLTVDIDQVGSTVAGADLTVFVRGRYIW